MSSGRIQRIQDSVHGLMEFRGMEASAIDLLRTPELQRLRRIRQLALVHLVFPGAEHSRLVHSLGASYLAILFGRHLAEVSSDFLVPELCPAEDSVRDLAIAALCHDLGHGPLSHAWEREIVGEHYNREDWHRALGLSATDPLLPDRVKWHEMVGHALLAWANRIIARDLFKRVPLTSDVVNTYLRQPYSHERLYEAINPYCVGESEYYLVVDTARFSMLSDRPDSRTYIIQDGKAVSANEHDVLQSYRTVSPETVRLFTIREAVPAVVSLINDAV